ncbi:hypothetical protein E1301_Tti006371 [Triplophysa tibetana]|uniref:HECT domain-containing protein n=1 Tax=Triplophysa tibetana TaxID=1572043 RepID=A0A5A9P194_9TELE|nr:hypothetical protein E1301_Tti006371 [Triplophysa tibetana]
MEDDLQLFLRSRHVPEDSIIRMNRDKIDKSVLSVMTDEQMAKYINSYGNRLAVYSFCQQTAASSDKESLLQKLRENWSKETGIKNLMARHLNISAEKTTRKIEIGWLHFGCNGYQQVRTNNGGGTRHMTTVSQIMEMGKNLFFPNGESPKGSEADFTFQVCDFKRKQIPLDTTVGNLYEETKLKLLRFYICTKQEKKLRAQITRGIEDVAQTDLTSTKVSSRQKETQRTHTVQRFASSSSDDETIESLNQSTLQPKSPQPLHELCDIPRGYEFIDLTNQIPPTRDLVETLEYDDKEDTIEWNEGDELGQTDEDQAVVIPWNLNENVILNAEIIEAETEVQLPPSSHPYCWVKVVEDLLAVFVDGNIILSTLKMDFVNESAVDDAGVSREVYTAFWDQFLEQCEGEDERIPRLRPDFSEVEWEAVGRIWVKGLLDLGILPVRLASAFILACMHGIDSVSDDVLMSSFHNYLSLNERSAVAKARQGTLEECDEEDLLDLFTRMGSHCIPLKNNIEVAIQTMAHKAILQEPKYIIDCFSKTMQFALPKVPDQERLLSLYDTKKATGKKVVQLLQTSQMIRRTDSIQSSATLCQKC